MKSLCSYKIWNAFHFLNCGLYAYTLRKSQFVCLNLVTNSAFRNVSFLVSIDSMQSAILFHNFCLSVCLSVCPPVHQLHCDVVSKWKDMSSNFFTNCSFLSPTTVTNFQGMEPSASALNVRVWKNFAVSIRNQRTYLGNGYETGPCLLWITNRKS